MTETEAAFALWSKTQHRMVKPGGTWAVPRSGLMFTRTENGFELNLVMPFLPEMIQALDRDPKKDIPKTPEELLAYQRQDFLCIQRNFKNAGLDVTDPRNLMGESDGQQ